MRWTSTSACAAFALASVACAQTALAAASRPIVPPNSQVRATPARMHVHEAHKITSYPTPIQHVVVVVMENRTIDNLFQLVPGADVSGISGLMAKPLIVKSGPGHGHGSFVTEFGGVYTPSEKAYVKPNSNYVGKLYYGLAEKWVLADEMFQTNEGPSFPAHQYLIAGQSGGINNLSSPFNIAPYAMAENPGKKVKSGCGNTSDVEEYIDMDDSYPGTEQAIGPPCDDYETVLDTVSAAFQPSSGPPPWRYYIAGPGNIWDAPDAVHHLYPAPSNQLITDITGQGFYNDVQTGVLAPLSYVIPCGSWSDHAGVPPATNPAEVGPNFVNFVVNTIGNSAYWPNTTILVTWDDWGGWYDHVQPPHTPNVYGNLNDPYEYGFRVPLLMISGWLKTPGVVDHTGQNGVALRSQAAILRYIETTFGLPSLGTADEPGLTDDLTEAFDYTRNQPLPFSEVKGGAAVFPAANASDCTHTGP